MSGDVDVPRLAAAVGGPGWMPLPQVAGSDILLTSQRERRAMSWQIARFTAEDLTQRIDERATAAATAAAGGLTQLRYRRATYPREVWLWRDTHCESPELAQLFEEIRESLQSAGLTVRAGNFPGIPTRVWWRPSDVITPSAEDGHRDHVMVALLTDGVDIQPTPLHGDLLAWAAACALAVDGVDEANAQRLRQALALPLSAWQIRSLRRHGGGAELVWGPQERCRLINWLLTSGFDTARGKLRRHCLAREAIAWWQARYEHAHAERARQSNRLRPWNNTEAARRWTLEAALLRLYLGPEEAVADLAQLAEAGFGREIRRRLAILRTWDMPRALEAEQVDSEDAADWRQQVIYLPWRWADYAEQPDLLDLLHRLGFGGHVLQGQVTGFRPPTRFALAVGALAGLTLAAFGAAAVKYLNPPSTQIVSQEAMLDRQPLQKQTLRRLYPASGTALIGHAKSAEVVTEVPPGAEIPVQWRWGPEQPGVDNNPVEPYSGSSGRLFVGGTLAEPVRPCDARWPARSVVVVQGRPTDPEPNPANQLAIALLDRGSADLVLVGNEWQRDLAKLPLRHPRLDRLTQLLVFLPPDATPPEDIDWPGPWALVSADYPAAVEALQFDGLRLLETMDAMNRIDGKGAIWLHGGPEKDADPKTGITWVHLCRGTFTMGTSDIDPEAAVKMMGKTAEVKGRLDERPAHRVSLSAFEITETEITNAQYRRLQPDHDPKAAPKQPAVNVTWQ
jgi:hypothetical protein